jgi:short-subunit dehydrogenase
MNIQQWIDASFDYSNDYALITGASSGIGYEYLKALSRAGCRCIATSNDAIQLKEACGSLRDESGATILEVVADLGTSEGIRDLTGYIENYSIGILVNNAGFGLKGSFLDHEPRRYSDLVLLNALAPTLISRQCIPQMLARARGLILHVASINAITPIAYNAVYTATKAYLLYYAYAVAHELQRSPLVFQIVLPGTTKTPFHERQGAVPKVMYMTPDVVVKRSLDNLHQALNISNKWDRLLYPVVSLLPLSLRVRVATYLLKRRLNLSLSAPQVPEAIKG